MRLLIRTILPVSIAIFLIDRLSKWYVVDVLDLKNVHQIEVFPPFLNFIMAWNEGINFGWFSGGSRWILVAIAVAISLGVIVWAIRRKSLAIGIGAGLVVGGAAGNAYDRMTDWQAVADFLNMSCCGINNPYSFNIADIAIFAGAIWIAIRA